MALIANYCKLMKRSDLPIMCRLHCKSMRDTCRNCLGSDSTKWILSCGSAACSKRELAHRAHTVGSDCRSRQPRNHSTNYRAGSSHGYYTSNQSRVAAPGLTTRGTIVWMSPDLLPLPQPQISHHKTSHFFVVWFLLAETQDI